MPTIRYYIKSNYGTDALYPVDHADALQSLTGNKTLTPKTTDALKKMGFTFEQVIKPETEQDKVKREGRY